jgi:hypothetical protein
VKDDEEDATKKRIWNKNSRDDVADGFEGVNVEIQNVDG